MNDSEPINLFTADTSHPSAPSKSSSWTKGKIQQIAFNRKELNEILRLYGRKVAAGEWRDYAIDMLREKAVFSIFRRSSEMPLYRIVKQPKLAQKQGVYSVITPTGLILRRGHDLPQVLKAIDRRPKLVSV